MNKKFPKIMGILNITPDSFSDGNDYNDLESSLIQAEKLLESGADILDIGGESSRPGADPVSVEEEKNRVLPLIKELKTRFPKVYISIDTTKYDVAKDACELGINMINDISGLQNEPRFVELAKTYHTDLCIMHMKGTPKNMQQNPEYEDLISEISDFLKMQTKKARQTGVGEIYIDPGIGFGKTQHNNIEILKNIDAFEGIADGILLGISRKSFIGKYFQIEEPKNRDLATTLIHSLLLNKKVDIIRVHNVDQLNTLKTAYKILN